MNKMQVAEEFEVCPAYTQADLKAITTASDQHEIDITAFRAVFDHAPCGMVLIDAGGVIASVNARLCDMFAYQPDMLIGRKIERLLPKRFHSSHVAYRREYTASPSPRIMGNGRDVTGQRSDGVEFPLEIGLTTIETATGKLSCASIVDITERKRTELKLREANALLEEFTYVASHDLRSPLRGIAHLIDFIREDYGDTAPASVLRNMDRMGERIQGMESLISDLLSYARAGRRCSKIEPIFLRALVEETLELEAISSHTHVDIAVPEESFEGAKTPLTTVMRNLISNSIKHHDLSEHRISISAHFENNMCVLDVTDDGPGIAEAAQRRMFRLFQTLNVSERKGSGLGLAVVQRLVEGHGGTIRILSRDGERGCTFRVVWPRFVRSDLDD
jgi:PAS domain S-box-containing protein